MYVRVALRRHVKEAFISHRKVTKTQQDTNAYIDAAASVFLKVHSIPEKIKEIPRESTTLWLKDETFHKVMRITKFLGVEPGVALEAALTYFLTKNGYAIEKELKDNDPLVEET